MNKTLFPEKSLMQKPHGFVGFIFLDHNGDFDFGSGNHFNIDLALGKFIEHASGNAGMCPHADTDGGNNGNVAVECHVISLEVFFHLFHYGFGIVQVGG